jgi:hypothetical protein
MRTLPLLFSLLLATLAGAAEIKTVHFQSEDQHTLLVAYLFEPQMHGPHAAIVLLHGRAGPTRRRPKESTTPPRSQSAIRSGANSGRNGATPRSWSIVSVRADIPADSRLAVTTTGRRKSVSRPCVRWMPMPRSVFCVSNAE